MLLKSVVGQVAAKNGLIQMYKSGHLPHALLLLGREGSGGLPLAWAFVQYLLCLNKTENDSCGICANCNKISKLEHADVHWSFPTIPPKSGTKAKSQFFIQDFRKFLKNTPNLSAFHWLQQINAENKQGNITAEECREIIDILSLKSYEGGLKIQLIWRPEYLGKEGNILLKLMEEPPANTLLILIAEQIEHILPTILSRTQQVKLIPLSATEIAQSLVDQNLADHRKAMQIGHIANGSFQYALELLQHLENDLFLDVRNWFNAVFTNNGVAMTKFVEGLSNTGREGQKNFLNYVIELLEHTLRAKYNPNITETMPPEEGKFVTVLANKLKSNSLIGEMAQEISKTIYFIERNAHVKSQLMALSLKLKQLIAA